jgi:signal recognition particle subunit SRP54
MGPLESILGMIPGLGQLKELSENKPNEKQMGRVEAIICSMTPDERRNDKIINGSRRKRIARGSGTTVEEVNRLLKQFTEMKKVLQMIGGGGMPKLPKGMKVPPNMQQAMRQGQPHAHSAGGGMPGKKRKKGGPWGLIKAR